MVYHRPMGSCMMPFVGLCYALRDLIRIIVVLRVYGLHQKGCHWNIGDSLTERIDRPIRTITQGYFLPSLLRIDISYSWIGCSLLLLENYV